MASSRRSTAETTPADAGAAAAVAPASGATVSAYYVFEERELFERGLSDVVEYEHGAAHAEAMYTPLSAWVPFTGTDGRPKIIRAAGKPAAIRKITGDDRGGRFKAVAVSAWKGGINRAMKLTDQPLED